MANIKVKLHGKVIQQLDLETGNEYIAGRQDQCHIQLEDHPGISRQHFKITYVNEEWQVEVMARYGYLYQDGEQASSLQLKNGISFTVPPYEFVFEEKQATIKANPATLAVINAPQAAHSLDAPPTTSNMLVPQDPFPVPDPLPEDMGNEENTASGLSSLVGQLKMYDSTTGETRVIDLNQNVMIFGRDKGCDYQVQSNHLSRRQFEISQSNRQWYVTDLGSSNGTKLNDQYLTPDKPTLLNSGDEISASVFKFQFEIIDKKFSEKMAGSLVLVNPQSMIPAGVQTDLPNLPMPSEIYGDEISEAVIRVSRKRRKKSQTFLEQYRKPLFAVAILLVGYAIFSDGDKATKGGTGPDQKTDAPLAFENLTDDKKREVVQKLALAKQLYQEQRYELAINELTQLHNIVPFYKDSQDLLAYAKSGQENVLKAAAIEEQRRKEQQTRILISNKVSECEATINPNTTIEELTSCLTPALELDPENPNAQSLIAKVKAVEEGKRAQEAARQARAARAADARRVLERARRLANTGKYLEALALYNTYLSDTADAGSTNEVRRELSSVQVKVEEQKKELAESANKFLKSNQYKEAVLAFDKALKIMPGEESLVTGRDRALSELRRQLKGIYEESVLEESIGNLEPAKDKWRKIKEMDIKGQEYYDKAQSKLRQYGAD